MKYAFIREHAGRWPVTHQCRLLRAQRSAYYDWRGQSCRVIPPEELSLRRRMKALFKASRDSLGSRMMMKKLRDEGFEIGRERTRKLMKALNLKVKHKRKYKVTTDSQHKLPVAENVLDRQFNPTGPNQVWGTDITYLWTHEGWIYLAVVIDLYSRRVVGWSIDRRMNTTWSVFTSMVIPSNQSHRMLQRLAPVIDCPLSNLVCMNLEIPRKSTRVLSPLVVTNTILNLRADE